MRSICFIVDSLWEIHKELLLRTSSELNDISIPNVLVTRPGPEANLSSLLSMQTALINTPLAKFFLSVTIFKQ